MSLLGSERVRIYGDYWLYGWGANGPWYITDPESVKPVENPKPAADPESATGVTLQPVDSTGKAHSVTYQTQCPQQR